MRAHPSGGDAPAMDEPAASTRYEIRVRGVLSATVLGAFPGMEAQTQRGETILSGALPDQAALYGVLAQLEALALELLEVRRDRSSAAAHHARSGYGRS
jgi:hypothetical protein